MGPGFESQPNHEKPRQNILWRGCFLKHLKSVPNYLLNGNSVRQTEIDVSPNSDSITLSIKCRKALLESEMPYSGLSDSRITVCSLMTISLVSLLGGIPISLCFTQYRYSGGKPYEHVFQVLPDCSGDRVQEDDYAGQRNATHLQRWDCPFCPIGIITLR